MKQIKQLLFGKNSKINGLIALLIVGSIALGCTCGKDFDLANMGKDSNSRQPANVAFDPDNTDFDTNSDSDSEPSEALAGALVRSTTAEFATAISTEDFSTLYGDASDEFKSSFTEEKTKEAFKQFITNKKSLLPILAKSILLDPEYTSPPSYRTQQSRRIMVVNGKYATTPLPINFEYEFIENDGKWKMFKLDIRVK